MKAYILAQFDNHNESLTGSKATLTKNKTIRKRLGNFIQSKYRQEDLEFNEIGKDFADEFYAFLREEYDLSNNSAVTYVWMMGKVFRYARNRGFSVPVDPAQYFSFSKDQKSINYLNEKQIEAFHKLDLKGDTDLVRDLFLYSCYTGMSLEELKSVSFEDVIYKDKLYWFSLKRGESFENRLVPCLPELMDIDNKYDDNRKAKNCNLIFPGIGGVSTSKDLKEIQKMIGIPFKLKFETARYTFATTVALKYQLPLFVVHDVQVFNASQKTTE